MPFQETKGRYASFGVVSTLPGEVIDQVWYVLDNYLKGVLPLKSLLRFQLKNRNGRISLLFSQEGCKERLEVDFETRFAPFYPSTLLVIDRKGRETVVLPEELPTL